MLKSKLLQKSKCRTSAQDQEQSLQPKPLSKPRMQSERNRLIEILRRITMAVQVFPFVYTVLFLFLFGAYSVSEGIVLDIIDYVSFVSPIVIVAHIAYSKMLKLCRWHRIACSLPLIPQAADLFDNYVYHFGHNAFVVVSITIMITIALFLVSIYKVFFTEDGKVC